MASSEGLSSNKALLFNDTSYAFWRFKMQIYLSALGYDSWEAIENGYATPLLITNVVDKKAYKNKLKAKNAIMCGFVNNELVRVMNCMSV